MSTGNMTMQSSNLKRGSALTAAVLLSAAMVVGCAADDPNRRAKTGAVIGAIGGAVVGGAAGDTKGAVIGGAVGAIAGGAVGRYMDRQARELEEQLAREQAAGELRISRMDDGSLRINIASDASFGFDSAELAPQARETFAKIANVLKDYDASVVHVVGHTDNVGSERYNQGLSERRASAVTQFLVSNGVVNQRLRQEGRSLREPIASNDTEQGRARNRRVDMVIKPVVEGREEEAFTPPPYLGA